VAGFGQKEIHVKLIASILLLLVSSSLLAQSEQDKLAAIEEARAAEKQRLIMVKLDSAVSLMELGEYAAADKKFKGVLANLKSLPSDLAYYFGENSFHLGLNRQSIDWLSKYLQMKGTAGKFSAKAAEYLKKAETALLADRKVEAQKATDILSKNYDIDCGPTGKVLCPVCAGSTVVVKRSYLGDTYKTCTYCNKLGYLTCNEYNKLLRGQLDPASN
jgi:hypothetical protein